MPPKLVQLVALLARAALLYAAACLMPGLNDGRKSLNMYGSQDVLTNTPPEYAFAIQAFGAFRSLIVNLAFIRAETYKEQGRYYDAAQLASWICQLQPRFPSVWEFQAWNMAWNISVTTFTAEERWNWVYNGVRLLRDEGLRYNPRAINLYKQIAWIFNNKMGENLDDYHWDYKRNWAWRMHLVLGPPVQAADEYRPGSGFKPAVFDVADDPLLEMARLTAAQQEEHRRRRQEEEYTPYRTTKTLEERLKEMPTSAPATLLTPAEISKRAARNFMQAIADAPPTLDDLYRQVPETRDMVTQLRDIGVVITDDTLNEDSYWYDGKLAQTFFSRYRKLMDSPALREMVSTETTPTPESDAVKRLDQLIGARAGRPAGQALVRFLRRKVLTEVYKLKPDRMVSLIDHFGALDWREVDTQSLYWVAEGLIAGGETLGSFENDKTNTARILFFSLRNLFQRNRMTFEPCPEDIRKSYISYAPDMDFVEPMHQAFITYGPLIDPDPGDTSAAGDIFRTGHVNFLTEAIRMLFFADRTDEAEKYYNYLREHYGRRPDGRVEPRYMDPLRDFVVRSLYGMVDTPRETERVIADLLFRAYQELSNENFTAYQQYVAKALDFRETYVQGKRGESTAARIRLRPFQDYQIDVFREWFVVPAVNSTITLHKVRLWRVAPPHLKQFVYDDLSEWFQRECAVWGYDVAKAFPEPPNMAEFRQQHPRREVERETPDVQTLPEP